jgi:hypothetical protein
LPQFDPETGKENSFSEVDHQKLKQFGWYPFTSQLAQKIMKAAKTVVTPTNNPLYTVTLDEGDRLVAYRTNTVRLCMRKGKVNYASTVYVLGIKGKKILQIDEEGNIVDCSS